jgi:hypothetical protein
VLGKRHGHRGPLNGSDTDEGLNDDDDDADDAADDNDDTPMTPPTMKMAPTMNWKTASAIVVVTASCSQ